MFKSPPAQRFPLNYLQLVAIIFFIPLYFLADEHVTLYSRMGTLYVCFACVWSL